MVARGGQQEVGGLGVSWLGGPREGGQGQWKDMTCSWGCHKRAPQDTVPRGGRMVTSRARV